MKKKLLFLLLGLVITLSAITVIASEKPTDDLLSIYNKRLDLQKAFPEVKNNNYGKLIGWAKKYGWKENDDLLEYSSIYSRLSELIDRKIDEKLANLPTNNGVDNNGQDNGNHNGQNSCNITCPHGEKGEKGEKGDKGDRGEQGIKGEKGDIAVGGMLDEDGEWLTCIQLIAGVSNIDNFIITPSGKLYCNNNKKWAIRYNIKFNTNITEITDEQILSIFANDTHNTELLKLWMRK